MILERASVLSFDINLLFPLQNNENYGKIYNYVYKKSVKNFHHNVNGYFLDYL